MKSEAEVKLIAYSIPHESFDNKQTIATFQLTYWKAVHPQMLTHRAFSRNAGSSRAIPTENVMIKNLLQDTWGPIRWGSNKPGMQAGEDILNPEEAENIWQEAAEQSIKIARKLIDLGVHKEIANRVLEPFSKIDVVLTATDFDNFFDLRLHDAAQPSIQDIAQKMRHLLDTNEPKVVSGFGWHLPYVSEEDKDTYNDKALLKLSVARCARVSYKLFDGSSNVDKDFELYESLLKDKHMSPFEHQARPKDQFEKHTPSNFTGWHQLRHDLVK